MLKRLLGVAALGACLASTSLAAVVISVNTKDGDVISGEHEFRVTVQSDNLVTQVEFYIGNDLQGSDDSTPYTFMVDTLGQKEGEFVVTFSAFTSEGESAKKTLRLRVDNELSKGLDYHVQKGLDALVDRKWDLALKSGRVAMKIDGKNPKARLLMSRANFGKGVMDLAQKFAEDVVLDDPTNRQALDLLSAISLQRAFNAFNSSGDQKTTLATMGSAMKSAAKSRRASMDATVDSFGAMTDANRLAYADTVIAAGRYSLAITALQPIFDKSQQDTMLANRLIYAKIRAGRLDDAQKTMTLHKRFGQPDGYGYALKAILDQYFGDVKSSEESEKEALLNDPGNLGVRFSQVYLALVRGRTQAFSQLIMELDKSEGASPITNYYLSARNFLLNDYEEARKRFETSLLAEPAGYDMYVERANQTIASIYSQELAPDQVKTRYDFALTYLDAGLVAKPESFEVLTGLCIVHMMAGRADQAMTFGRAAAAAGPEYAPAHYALAGAYRLGRRQTEAAQAMEVAGRLDARLKGRPSPTPEAAWQIFYRNGRIPNIPSPGQAGS